MSNLDQSKVEGSMDELKNKFYAGQQLKFHQIRRIVSQLELNGEDLDLRIALLGYARLNASTDFRYKLQQEQLYAIALNWPDHPLHAAGFCQIICPDDLEFNARMKKLWKRLIDSHPSNLDMLLNASYCFEMVEPIIAKKYAEIVLELDGTNERALKILKSIQQTRQLLDEIGVTPDLIAKRKKQWIASAEGRERRLSKRRKG